MPFTVAGVSKFYVVNKKIRGQGGQRDIRPSAEIEDYIYSHAIFLLCLYLLQWIHSTLCTCHQVCGRFLRGYALSISGLKANGTEGSRTWNRQAWQTDSRLTNCTLACIQPCNRVCKCTSGHLTNQQVLVLRENFFLLGAKKVYTVFLNFIV